MYVLIVDDQRSMRDVLKSVLEQEGHKTCFATNGEGALRQVEIEKPDLVLLDVELGPGLDGIEVARRMPRHIPIIIVSGLSAGEIRARATSIENAITGALAI